MSKRLTVSIILHNLQSACALANQQGESALPVNAMVDSELSHNRLFKVR
jgi:hypothetical protein